MANDDDELRKYEEDSREACKYGKECYQKNPKHKAKFKHPPITQQQQHMSTKKRRGHGASENGSSKKKRSELEADLVRESSSKQQQQDTRSEEEDLPPSPHDPKESIKQKFLLEVPDDFSSFWEFCQTIEAQHPEDALKKIVDLQLVGPFDILSGKMPKEDRKASTYLCHWRYYYDPPEFVTVLKGNDDSQFHIGYFRDNPGDVPVLVASNEASRGCAFKVLGGNLFAALNSVLSEHIAASDDEVTTQLEVLRDSLCSWSKKHKFSLEKKTAEMKSRDKMIVAKGFHGLGIVVPYNRETGVGYRPLPESDASLKKMLKSIIESKTDAERDKKFDDDLQEIVTLVQFANDECDFGMGLELGLNLFSFGHSFFHHTVVHLMQVAYDLLQRSQFGEVLKAHVKARSLKQLCNET